MSINPNMSVEDRDKNTLRLNFFELLETHASQEHPKSKKRLLHLQNEIRNQITKLSVTEEFQFCSNKEDQRALTRDIILHWQFASNHKFKLLEALKDLLAAWEREKQLFVHSGVIPIGRGTLVRIDNLNIPEPGSTALITRCGNVEMRVIDAIYTSESKVEEVVNHIQTSELNDDAMYGRSQSIHQYSNDDIDWSVKLLMTNAGMYFPDQGSSGFKILSNWYQRYLAALSQSNNIIDNGHLGVSPNAWSEVFAKQQGMKSPCRFNGKNFLEGLNGHSIVFATPFAGQINKLYANGEVPQLYKNFALPDFKIAAIEAPISTWPNRPDDNWQETFQKLLDASIRTIKKERATLFVSSCGSYGLPLSLEVHKISNVVTIYAGHAPNNLLGVMTNRFRNPPGFELNESSFLPSHLREVANVSRIDGGGYV